MPKNDYNDLTTYKSVYNLQSLTHIVDTDMLFYMQSSLESVFDI